MSSVYASGRPTASRQRVPVLDLVQADRAGHWLPARLPGRYPASGPLPRVCSRRGRCSPSGTPGKGVHGLPSPPVPAAVDAAGHRSSSRVIRPAWSAGSSTPCWRAPGAVRRASANLAARPTATASNPGSGGTAAARAEGDEQPGDVGWPRGRIGEERDRPGVPDISRMLTRPHMTASGSDGSVHGMVTRRSPAGRGPAAGPAARWRPATVPGLRWRGGRDTGPGRSMA